MRSLTLPMKKARLNPVTILSDQNEHFEKKRRKLGSPITKVLRSLNADVGRDYYELLYNFLPGDQRGRAAEIAAFCHFVQERQQIFQDNVERIRARNAEFDRGQASFELRVNCFGDLR